MSKPAKFFYEAGMLMRTPRSGFQFLGSGSQSVAEHTYRMLNIAFVLNRLVPEPADELHLLKLVLFHDLPEARTGDLTMSNEISAFFSHKKMPSHSKGWHFLYTMSLSLNIYANKILGRLSHTISLWASGRGPHLVSLSPSTWTLRRALAFVRYFDYKLRVSYPDQFFPF